MSQTSLKSVSFAISGSGGAGVMTAGEILLMAAAKAGYYGLQTRSVGPQIRGGEAASLMRLATFPVHVHADAFHILLAVDWLNFDRFSGEIDLAEGAIVITGEDSGDLPEKVARTAAEVIRLPFHDLLKETKGRVNMLAVGLVGRLIGLPQDALADAIARRFASKGNALVELSVATMRAGYAQGERLREHEQRLAPPEPRDGERWIINGNEAAGLGALTAGVKFAAAYPITPATEILEWLSPALSGAGGMLIQAEDELASINMIIGASFGGAPAITATSGPGLALMAEGLGLAAAAEIPVTVIDVQRGGPSTGIPTKSEQTDLNIALCGMHGEAPHLVLAATSVADCIRTTAWAVHLSERLQAPAIMLSDQMMGQMKTIMPRPELPDLKAERETVASCGEDGYARYALTANGVSPMALPGAPGCMYTADGLEHDERAVPSTRVEDHAAQLKKRWRKLADFDYGDAWADISGEGPLAVITWGSTAGAVEEAAREAEEAGAQVRTIVLRLLSPPQTKKLEAALEGVETLLVVENSFSGQFERYLRSFFELPEDVRSFRHPGPRPVTAREILKAIREAAS